MKDLVPVLIMGILTYGVYAIIELYARRNERMAIIEKLANGLEPEKLKLQMKSFMSKENNSWAIKIGCLLLGIGLGVALVAILELSLRASGADYKEVYQPLGAMYPAAAALFGGLGLVIAYLIERKYLREDRNDKSEYKE